MTSQSNNSSALANYDANNDHLCNADGCDEQPSMPRMFQINQKALPTNEDAIYNEILGGGELRGLFNPKTERRVCAIFGLRLARIGFKTITYKDPKFKPQLKINVYCFHEASGEGHCYTAGAGSWWARSFMTAAMGMIRFGLVQSTFNLSTVPGTGTCMFANLSSGDVKPYDYSTAEFFKANKDDQEAVLEKIQECAALLNNAIAGILPAEVSDATPLALTGGEDDNDMPLEFLEDEQTQPAPAA